MTHDEFEKLLDNFAIRSLPATNVRHLYLWHGELSELRRLLPVDMMLEISLLELCVKMQRRPYATEEARRLLVATLRQRLESVVSAPGVRQVIVVTGTALLLRYRMSLTDFYQYVSETRMVILIVTPTTDRLKLPRPLPPYIDYNSNVVADYLLSIVGPAASVEMMRS